MVTKQFGWEYPNMDKYYKECFIYNSSDDEYKLARHTSFVIDINI